MKSKPELKTLIDVIAAEDSPVGMDAVYVHALILDKLESLEQRLQAIEARLASEGQGGGARVAE